MSDDVATLVSLYLPSVRSEDEETDRWRAALRREVEEDLERQVRLRLGLECNSKITEGRATHPLTHHHGTHRQFNSQTIIKPQSPGEEEGRGESGSSEEEVQGGGREERKRVAIAGGKKRIQVSQGGNASAELFQYLSKHHGPPLKQLGQLACRGMYKTDQAPAGEGGPSKDIRWPVEANILLSTPQHIITSHCAHVTASLLASSRESQIPSSHVQFPRQSFGRSCNDGLVDSFRGGQPVGREGRGSVVYVCGKGAAVAGKVEKDGLVFESRFESGNLYQARQTGPHDYTLVLNPDLYTKKHVQWYYFCVTNTKTTPTYTFHIINFDKHDSLYNYGMQPLLYSESEASSNGVGWRRVGWNVVYHQSRHHYPPHMSPDRSYFTLSWSMQFHHHGDTCYLAHCYPYPLSALHRLLGDLERDPERAKYVRREELCQTLAGNECPLLTVTDFSTQGWEQGGEGEGGRRGVVITARVHPGESNSSWMMEGLLLFLTSSSLHAHALRQCFVFKVVPMLNPDGVVVGNYRTSLAGVDLNRVYKRPLENLFPTVYHTKKMMAKFHQEREVCVYVDLHGHSRKHNVFVYGCHTPQADHTHFLYERMLPFLLSQQAPSKFCFASCKFAVQRYKEATGRVVAWRSGVPNCFTLEATFCGSNLGPSSWQFTENDLCEMGRDLGEALYQFSKCIHSKAYQLKVMAQLAEKLMEKVATPTDSTPSQHVALPDVVTSAASHSSHPHSSHSHSSHSHSHSSHSHKKHAQRTLHRFMKVDMCHLELESSTSGSDSDNDNFKFKRKQKCKHRNHRRQRSLGSQMQSQLPGRTSSHPPSSHSPSSHPLTHFTSTKEQSPQQLTLPSLLDQAPPPCRMRASAPARLQSMQTHVGSESKWKFVNHYANRSNGGIPMFAEERLKARAEKRLRSLSEAVHLPPAPLHPNMAASGGPATGHTNPSTCVRPLAQKPHPLWISPTYHHNSRPDSDNPHAARQHLPSHQRHYQHIKDLVEHHSHNSTLHSPSYITHHSSHTSHIPQHSSQRSCAPFPPFPSSHLPSHIITYISEVWNK